MDSFLEKPSRDVPSDRLGNWMRLRRCGDTERLGTSTRRGACGENPGQDVRSATEAAGAANVVDGTPPGERGQRSNGWTTHRKENSTEKQASMLRSSRKKAEPGKLTCGSISIVAAARAWPRDLS